MTNLLESRATQLRVAGRRADEVRLWQKAALHHRAAQVLVELAKHAVVRQHQPLDGSQAPLNSVTFEQQPVHDAWSLVVGQCQVRRAALAVGSSHDAGFVSLASCTAG